MSIRDSLPTPEELKKIDENFNFKSTDEELEFYAEVFGEAVKSYEYVEKFQLTPAINYEQNVTDRAFTTPSPDDNPFNAWYVKCNLQAKDNKDNGKLSGKKVAIKDSIAVANMQMMAGSELLEGYIPEYDATVVRRILSNGGTIVGKTTCEDMGMSGGSHITKYGPVKNPINPAYTAGGSSSGNAVVLCNGEADMAIGGDQGGSIRMPASCCGIVGLKPTHGLVPYTGAIPIVTCLDHLGPMARTVSDCKLLLECIAGDDDWSDYRQHPQLKYFHDFKEGYGEEQQYKIGILKEGFERCDKNVQKVFLNAVEILKSSRMLSLEEISFPLFKDLKHVYFASCIGAIHGSMVKGNCYGFGAKGMQSHSLGKYYKDRFEKNAEKSCATFKSFTLIGEIIDKNFGSFHISKANTIAVIATREFDKILKENDFIILPTLVRTPPLLPKENASVRESFDAIRDMNTNTGIFNLTGHPALSLNCGYHHGLPVGLQIVGKHFEDFKLLNCASVFEEAFSNTYIHTYINLFSLGC